MKPQPVSIVILAGGKSSRMGVDKASLPWDNSDILHSLIERLQPASADIVVVSNHPRALSYPVRVVPDSIPECGPLSGIHAGLIHARQPVCFVCSCDLPFLNPQVIPILLDYATDRQFDALIPKYKERYQPLLACYHTRAAGAIEQALRAGAYRLMSLLPSLQCLYVPEEIWPPAVQPDKLFFNMNTYEDYLEAYNYNQSR